MNDSLSVCAAWQTRRQAGPRWLALLLSALASLLVALPAQAEPGLFEVIRAEAREVDGAWWLDSQLDLELSSDAVEALENGVMLSFRVQFEMTRQRSFWTDLQVTSASQDFELKYMALNERYVVRNVTTGEQQNYATLFSALRNMGRIRDWPVVPAGMVQDNETYLCAIRVVLDQDSLPGPLQLLAFWRGDFILESEWYRWKLR